MNTISRHIAWKISWVISHDILMADPLIHWSLWNGWWMLMALKARRGLNLRPISEQEIGLSIPSAPVDRK